MHGSTWLALDLEHTGKEQCQRGMRRRGSTQDSIHTVSQERILDLYNNQLWNIKQIAKEVHLKRSTISNWLKAQGIEVKKRRKPVVKGWGGYVLIYSPEHPNTNANGYVAEHTLKASAALGRPLKKGEIVHHINGDKHDNSNSNLLVCGQPYHMWLHWRMSDLYAKEHFACS